MLPKILVSASEKIRIEEIDRLLSEFKITRNHPDILLFEIGSKLGMEQARAIKEHFSIKPYSAEGRAVVLEDASDLTHEAQNALLKTLEESPEKALIILGVNSEQDLIQTVLSRCEIIQLNPRGRTSEEVGPLSHSSKLLINATIEERFEYVEKLKEKEEFLKELVRFWREELLKNPNKQNKEFIKELLEAEKWFAQNVNQRAILEYLMMVMPQN